MSYDMQVGTRTWRHLFPLITIDKSMLGAEGKLIALMWLLWLDCGPSFEALRWFCDCIKGICTDMGAERLLLDAIDALPDLFVYLSDAYINANFVRLDFIFPNALHCPGWKHRWDNLLRRGLPMLSFFPSWLDLFKHVVTFLRDDQTKLTLSRHLKAINATALAEMVRKGSATY